MKLIGRKFRIDKKHFFILCKINLRNSLSKYTVMDVNLASVKTTTVINFENSTLHLCRVKDTAKY